RAVLRKCQKGDVVLVALSGHGLQFAKKQDSFYCPLDARPFEDETDSMISVGSLYLELGKSFASAKIVLVDACRNDPRERSGADGDGLPRPPLGVAAWFSCSPGEKAREHEKFGHGIFFHFLLEGLRGAAADRDGEVTFSGLQGYVNKRVQKEVPTLFGG